VQVEVGGRAGENRGKIGGSIVSLSFGAFAFHADRRQLFRDGIEVHLTPKAFDLLLLLIERAPAVVPKAELHARLWPDTFVSDATLLGLVKEVRRALNDDHQGTLVRTAHRVGYAFAGSMRREAATPTGSALTYWVVDGTRRVPLREGINVIGRDADSAVWLDVPGVSRRHAHIVIEGGSAWLEDLGSKNGTLVGGQPVVGRVLLRHADHIRLATETLEFHVSATGMPTITLSGKAGSPQGEGQ
jgi:DNA-binding winged helix-turn-helix (wHTH) protein